MRGEGVEGWRGRSRVGGLEGLRVADSDERAAASQQTRVRGSLKMTS